MFKGYKLRFIDTAGLRTTKDKIEQIGISKTYKKIKSSAFILYMIDKTDFIQDHIEREILKIQKSLNKETVVIILCNKLDLDEKNIDFKKIKDTPIINISAKKKEMALKKYLELLSQVLKNGKILMRRLLSLIKDILNL